MFKKTLFSFLLMAAVSQAAVKELIPNLTSTDLKVQTQARLDLLADCSQASRPDAAEADRKAICLEMCEILEGKYPVVTVIQPVLNNLERIGGEESVPTLAKLLSHKDEHIRDDARRALAVNPSPKAAQALGSQLKMRKVRTPKETAGLITALAERKEAGASNLIAGQLRSRDMVIFLAAAKALGRLNENAGIKALASQRTKENGFRKTQIDAALFSTERKAVFAKLNTASEPDEVQAVALMGLILSGETGLASDAMASGQPARQLAVIEAALQGKDSTVYDAVAANIGILPPHIQLQAVGALEFSGNRGYAQAIEPLLQADDIFMQDNVSRALAHIGTADSVALLMANGRPEARKAMGRITDRDVDAALEKTAASSPDANARATAIDALAIRGRQDLIPAFFEYAADDNKTVYSAAFKAIGSIGDLSHIEQLIDLMIERETSPASRNALNAIVAIMRRSTTPGEAVDILVSRMDTASPRSQANMLQALVQSGSNEALKPIVEACKSSDEKLQKQAIKLLSGWKYDNAIPTMIELAADKSMSMANHVSLMRGIARLFAAQQPWKLNKDLLNQALETCRRSEEREQIQAVIDKLK